MARIQYLILSNGGRWKIRHNEKDYEYATQAEAMHAAVEAAHKSGEMGHDAQVLIQGRDGQWQTEWTYGHDPYPPRG